MTEVQHALDRTLNTSGNLGHQPDPGSHLFDIGSACNIHVNPLWEETLFDFCGAVKDAVGEHSQRSDSGRSKRELKVLKMAVRNRQATKRITRLAERLAVEQLLPGAPLAP